MTPVEVVERQVDAYNARDLARVVGNYSDTVTVFRIPALEPAIAGKAQFAEFYATQRFNLPDLHADIVKRTGTASSDVHSAITPPGGR
jgi:hypothetical protein